MTQRRQFGRVRRLASGRWQARYPVGAGQDVPAPHTFATKGDAQRFLTSIEADMLKGAYIDPRSGRTTLTEWSRQWLNGDPGKRATTRARDESVLRTHFLPLLGNRPLGSITPLDVRRTVEAMNERLAPATVRTNLAVLAAVLNAAVEADLIGRSPVRGIKLASERPSARGPSPRGSWSRPSGEVPGRYLALILLGGMVGLRWSEAIGLTIGKVHFLSRTIEVSETIAEVGGAVVSRGHEDRIVGPHTEHPKPLVEELAHHLATFRPGAEPTDLVFTGARGMPLRRSFAARVFKPAVKRAGVDPDAHVPGPSEGGDELHGRRRRPPPCHPVPPRPCHCQVSEELYAKVSDAAEVDAAARLGARFSSATGTQRARNPKATDRDIPGRVRDSL